LAQSKHNPAPGLREELPGPTANRLQIVGLYAHEITNHVTVILGACELAASTDLSPEAEANLAMIRAAALMIARLTQGLEPLQH
jgi:hypothetical protein